MSDDSLFTVKPGIIGIENISVIHRIEGVLIWSITCAQNRPVVQGVSTRTIYLGADEGTGKVTDPSLPPTEVSLREVPSGWHTFAEAGRYDVMVCTMLLRHNPDLDPLGWSPPPEGILIPSAS